MAVLQERYRDSFNLADALLDEMIVFCRRLACDAYDLLQRTSDLEEDIRDLRFFYYESIGLLQRGVQPYLNAANSRHLIWQSR